MTISLCRRGAILAALLAILAGAAPTPRPLFALPALAQLHPPEIRSLYPLGGSAGATTRVTIDGVSLRGASAMLFDRPGITGKIVPPDAAHLPAVTVDSDGNPSVAVDITIDASAIPGICQFRVASAAGVSSPGKWEIGRAIPQMEEKEPNNEIGQAQTVTLPMSINGRISEQGDADTFGFDLEAGKTFVAEAMASRVGSPLDSLLTLRTAAGREVASNDDFYGADSLIVYKAPVSGHYFITITSSVQDAGANQTYRLSIGYLGLLRAVFPASVQMGRTTQVSLLGANLPATVSVSPNGAVVSVYAATKPESNGMPVDVSTLPTIMEQEPNDDMPHANAMPAPGVANGQFWSHTARVGGDIDFYKFHADAGRRFIIDAQCQAIGTRCDPILTLLDAKGGTIQESDDFGGRDSHLDFVFPTAGDYYLRIKDVIGRSGPDEVYRIIIQDPPPPGFSISTETRARVVGQGDSAIFDIAVARNRWDGPIALSIADLPAGVTATTETIPAGVGRGMIVVSAKPGTAVGAFPIHITGAATVNGVKVQEPLTQANDWLWMGGARRNEAVPAGLLDFAVGSPAEAAPKTDAAAYTLTQGQSVTIKVHIDRRVAGTKAMTVRPLGLPDGVTAKDVPADPKTSDVVLELKATPAARLGATIIVVDAVATNNPMVSLDRFTSAITLTVEAKK